MSASIANKITEMGDGRGPETVGIRQLLVYTAQLALIFTVAYLFKIEENAGILKIAPLVIGGFIVHALLPLRMRPAFFLLISLYSITMFMGLRHAGGMIAIGLGLIGVCHFPIALRARVAMLLGVGVLLALVRSGTIETTFWRYLPSPVIPMLSIMFMFRLALYLHALEYSKMKVPITKRLAYFYLLPSMCFPLCPVLDFNTYCRTYYDKPAGEIYQKGLRWMLRGMFHLLLYRLVYHYMAPMPNEVQDLGGTVQFAVSSYLLYLRVSGLFHLIVGILCLFGYNLPETHRLYYFASSFTDFWRRINIYWKDFMMTLVYYPLVMRLRRFGMATAIGVASVLTLVVSWLLHSYQIFWLKGQLHLTLQDALFWLILGVFVSINALLEYKFGAKASLSKPDWSLSRAILHSVKTVAFFTTMTMLWSFWTSESIASWWSVMTAAGNSGPLEFFLLGVAMLGLVVAGVVLQFMNERFSLIASMENYGGWRPVAATSAFALLLIVIAQPGVHGQLGTSGKDMFALLSSEQMNRRDNTRMTRGYYEKLLDNQMMAAATFINIAIEPADWGAGMTTSVRPTDNLLIKELKPSWEGIHKRVQTKFNKWGMRDKEYDKEKPEGTFRVAMLGASFLYGSGVKDREDFESRLEKRLNEENSGDEYANYELLNFGVGGTSPPQNVYVLREKALAFNPDMVIYVETTFGIEHTAKQLSIAIKKGVSLEYPYLESVIEAAQVNTEMSREEIQRRLTPYSLDLIEWSYAEISRDCRERGLPLVWIPMPHPYMLEKQNREVLVPLAKLAEEKGFIVLNLDGVYAKHSRDDLVVASWDYHPNVLGHRLLTDAIYEEMRVRGIFALMGFDAGDVQ